MRIITLQNDGAHLMCPVRINRKGEGWLLLDTGARSTLLYRSAAERLHVRLTTEQSKIFILGRGQYTATVGVVDRLELSEAGWEARNVRIIVADDSLKFKEDALGILGMDILTQLGMFLLDNKRLTILSPNHTVESRFIRIDARFDSHRRGIYLPLRLGTALPIHFLWDTGSDTTIISPNILPAQLHRRQGRREKVPRSEITVSQTDAAGTEQQTLEAEYWWRFPSARLGTIELNPFPVFEYGKPTHLWSNSYGLLGSPLLTEFEVLHDFSKQQLYMRRYRQHLAGTYGLMLTLHETPTGLSWKAFLNFPTEVVGRLPAESGVELLAVNDISVSRWETIPLIRHLLFPPARRRCKIRYRVNGKVAEAVLQAVGVPYIGVPPQLLGIVQVPKAEVGLGRTPERRVLLLKLSPRLRGVRGAQRQLNVRYVEHRWRFD